MFKLLVLSTFLLSNVGASPFETPPSRFTPSASNLASRQLVSSSSVLTRRTGLHPRTSRGNHRPHGHTTELHGPTPVQFFTVNMTYGSQSFEAIFDTGSSDVWVVEEGFQCFNPTDSSKIPESACNFSSKGFVHDGSFGAISDTNFNVSYSGYHFSGAVGHETIEVAGIKVPNQEVGLVNKAAALGDGSFSGILGFAFPSLTGKYSGSDPSKDIRPLATINPKAVSNQLVYSSLMNTIFFVQNLTEPVFSLILSRDKSHTSFGGLLTIGGVHHDCGGDPRINITRSSAGNTAKTPLEIARHQIIDPLTPEYQFYTISPNHLIYKNSPPPATTKSNRTQFIVDSGTPLIYIPNHEAAAVNALFNPPAQLVQGTFVVQCNATTPAFGVSIAGQAFYINPEDMVEGVVGSELCVSAIQPIGTTAGSPCILGATFLRNVLAVFDVGRLEMEFASRMYYRS